MGGISHKFSLITFIESFLIEELRNLQNEIILLLVLTQNRINLQRDLTDSIVSVISLKYLGLILHKGLE